MIGYILSNITKIEGEKGLILMLDVGNIVTFVGEISYCTHTFFASFKSNLEKWVSILFFFIFILFFIIYH